MLPQSPLPKHYQLSQILRQRISLGELSPGAKIPGELQLCQEFHVSRGTVRKAISTLINENLLRTEQGHGTYVTNINDRQRHFLSLNNFNEEMIHRHQQPKTRLLERKLMSATEEIANQLQIPKGAQIILIARLRSVNEIPILYERRFLAYDLCPALMDEDLEGQSIHELLINKYHIPLVKTVHVLESRGLTPEEARLLHVEKGSAAFYVNRLTYTLGPFGEKPAVWYLALYRGDEYTFRVEHIMEQVFPTAEQKD